MNEDNDGLERHEEADGEENTPGYAENNEFFGDAPPAGGEPRACPPRPEEGANRGKSRPRLWTRPEKPRGKKYSKSFYVALSAMSCALAVIFLMLGYFSDVLLGTGYILAEIALMVPLAKRSYLGSFLAYLGTVLLAVIFGAAAKFWDLVPFVIFFGLHPMANCFQREWRLSAWLALPVKAVWFDSMLFAAYYVIFGGVFGMEPGQSAFFDVVNDYIWLFILVLGTAFFVFYDYVMFRAQRFVDYAVSKVKK